ncbi:MAG: hypothetical protein KBC95_00490 [Candidatus Peribacteraceae bacterium]|nr:hypothetical protein [Candidatus Peribacteraceae bacterium]
MGTIHSSLETLADEVAAVSSAPDAGLVSARVAAIRSVLERLAQNDRSTLDRLLADRSVAADRVAAILAAPAPEALREPVLPFAQTEAFGALTAKLTPTDGRSPERPQYPQGVAPHLDSHHAQLSGLIERGDLPAAYEPVLRAFIELHDRGYAGPTGPLSLADYEADEAAFKDTYQALGATKDQSDRMAAFAKAGLADQNPVKQHLLGRVIGHGVNSVRYGRETLQQAGLDERQALALSKLYATHHLGYPLTPLVDGFARIMGGAIPADLRQPFLVGGEDAPAELSPVEREALAQDRADAIRARIADESADELGIDPQDARAIAAVAYALDRLTPARRMRDLDVNRDGAVRWTGGETEKRYPLIVGNIDGMLKNAAVTQKPAKNLATVYELSLVQFAKERDAALRTVKNLEVTGLDEVIRRQSAREMLATKDVQDRALAVAAEIGVGSFGSIAADRERVLAVWRMSQSQPEGEGYDLDALGYLLGTLTVMEPNVKRLFPEG